MTNSLGSLFVQRKKTFAALGLLVLAAAWWAFRPEKLFINKHVDEPAPFAAAGGPQPVLTGPLENAAQDTLGVATIYKDAGGRQYLRLSGLSAQEAQLQVALKGTGPEIHLGTLGTAKEQTFDLAAPVDLSQYDTVVMFNDRAVATAKLQPF